MADTRAVEYIINVIFASFAIGILLVVFQYHTNIHDITSLHQVPVVVRNTVCNDIVRPFLEGSCVYIHFVGMPGIQVVIQEIVKGNDVIKNIFVNNLKRTHAYQSLLMTVVEVDGNIPIIDTCHIGIEYSGSEFCISFFSGKPVKEGGITGDTHDFTVQALDVASGFRRMYTLHRAAGQGVVTESHISFHIVIVWHYVFQTGASVGGKCAARTGIANGGYRCFFASGMVEGFAFYIYIRSMRLPIHGKA